MLAAVLAACGVIGALAWKNVIPARSWISRADPDSPNATTRREVADAEGKLSGIQEDLNGRLLPALARFCADRDEVKTKLKALGVSDSKDLKDNFKAQSLGRELAELVGLIRITDQKRAAYERSSFELESMIRRLKRTALAENAGLSDEEVAEVDRTLRTIDAQLGDITQAPPELNPAQFDSLIDEELSPNWLDTQFDRQLGTRRLRVAALTERLSAFTSSIEAAARNADDAENFQSLLRRACRQAADEDRWPVKVAGRDFTLRSAEAAQQRAGDYIQRQRSMQKDLGPSVERLQRAVSSLNDEMAELLSMRDAARSEPRTAGDPEPGRIREIKARLSFLSNHAPLTASDPLLADSPPSVEPFDLDGPTK